jgi:hypothetical protein
MQLRRHPDPIRHSKSNQKRPALPGVFFAAGNIGNILYSFAFSSDAYWCIAKRSRIETINGSLYPSYMDIIKNPRYHAAMPNILLLLCLT